jgi:hypothetical protein
LSRASGAARPPAGAGLLHSLSRIPFTLFFETAIVAIALWNGSAQGRLSADLRHQWGFAPLYFWREHWHTLVTGAFFVRSAIMLLGMALFVAASVGVYEWLAGTRRALLVFWAANVVTLLLTAACVVFPMHLAGVPPRWDWAPSGDVGASFGGFGCIGAWMMGVSGTRRRIILVAIVTAGLVVKFLLQPEIFPDAGHLVAFLAGVALGAVLRSR